MGRTLVIDPSEEPAAAASVVAAAAIRLPERRKKRRRHEKMGRSVEDLDTPTEESTDFDATADVAAAAALIDSPPRGVFAVCHSWPFRWSTRLTRRQKLTWRRGQVGTPWFYLHRTSFRLLRKEYGRFRGNLPSIQKRNPPHL